jgi:hypothetical protein
MKRRLLFSSVSAATILLVIVLFLFHAVRPTAIVMQGSLFVSDSGRSHGGFEYNAEWNATVTVQESTGVLRLALHIGLGDALQKHEYSVTDFVKDSNKVSMKIDGQPIMLVWQENDQVWAHEYDRYYVASWGSDSPHEEIRGAISPLIFPGLAEHCYIELRLR